MPRRVTAASKSRRRVIEAWRCAVVPPLDRVFLHQNPRIATVVERADELVGDVRVVGQRHFRGREAAHPRHSIEAEEGGKVVLPGAHMQPEILRRRRWRNRVAPWASKPLDCALVLGTAGQWAKAVENIARPHLSQSIEQGAGVFEHHPRFLALFKKLRHEIAHPLIAAKENAGVVVVADSRVFHHVLQVADDLGAAQDFAARRDQRLVHVQGDRTGAANVVERNTTVAQECRLIAARRECLLDDILAAGQVGQAVDGFGQIARHGRTPFDCPKAAAATTTIRSSNMSGIWW